MKCDLGASLMPMSDYLLRFTKVSIDRDREKEREGERESQIDGHNRMDLVQSKYQWSVEKRKTASFSAFRCRCSLDAPSWLFRCHTYPFMSLLLFINSLFSCFFILIRLNHRSGGLDIHCDDAYIEQDIPVWHHHHQQQRRQQQQQQYYSDNPQREAMERHSLGGQQEQSVVSTSVFYFLRSRTGHVPASQLMRSPA